MTTGKALNGKPLVVLCAIASLCGMFAACGAENLIWDDRPGEKWESSWYPLGNGRLGCMVDGGVRNLRVQFNVDSLWTGDENISKAVSDREAAANYKKMGEYQNFGELEIVLGGLPDGEPTGYRRSLDIASAVYADAFSIGDAKISRQMFASAPDDCIVIVVRSENRPLDLTLRLKGAHGEAESVAAADDTAARLSGRLPNGLAYAACAQLFYPSKMQAEIILRAATGTESMGKHRRGNAAAMLDRSVADYRKYYDRMTFDLGKGDETVPTRVRIDRVRKGGKDPALIALMFNFGRYLLTLVQRARHAPREPAGHLEQQQHARLAQRLPHEHQHPDELLGRGFRKPLRLLHAAFRLDDELPPRRGGGHSRGVPELEGLRVPHERERRWRRRLALELRRSAVARGAVL